MSESMVLDHGVCIVMDKEKELEVLRSVKLMYENENRILVSRIEKLKKDNRVLTSEITKLEERIESLENCNHFKQLSLEDLCQ